MTKVITVWVIDVKGSSILVEPCFDGIVPAVLTVKTSFVIYESISRHRLFVNQKDLALPTACIEKQLFDELIAQGVVFLTSNKQPISQDWAYYLPYRTLVGHINQAKAHSLSYALQLFRWRIHNKYCSRCGTKFIIQNQSVMVCFACGANSYPIVSPCVITAVTRHCPTTGKPELLLAQHHRHKDGMYGLIAGFVETGESLENAVAREVFEETHLTVGNIRYSQSQPWPYPSNLMIGFRATYQQGDIVADELELTFADFFYLDDLPRIPAFGTIARDLIECAGKEYQIPIICQNDPPKSAL